MHALESFVRVVDRANEAVGRAVAWLTLAMVLVAFAVVVLRYVYAVGWVWLQETTLWAHALVFLLGAGYTLLHDGHVRVDVFYRPAGPRRRALVDLLGALLLLLPTVGLLAFVSGGYVFDSWASGEASREAGGLPALYLLKTAIPLFCLLLGLQGLALAARSLLVLRGRELAPTVSAPGAEQRDPI